MPKKFRRLGELQTVGRLIICQNSVLVLIFCCVYVHLLYYPVQSRNQKDWYLSDTEGMLANALVDCLFVRVWRLVFIHRDTNDIVLSTVQCNPSYVANYSRLRSSVFAPCNVYFYAVLMLKHVRLSSCLFSRSQVPRDGLTSIAVTHRLSIQFWLHIHGSRESQTGTEAMLSFTIKYPSVPIVFWGCLFEQNWFSYYRKHADKPSRHDSSKRIIKDTNYTQYIAIQCNKLISV